MKQKGCIVEVRRETVVVMTDTCDFVEISRPLEPVAGGMEVEFVVPETGTKAVGEKRVRGMNLHLLTRWAATAALIMLVVLAGLFWRPGGIAEAVYLVSIDLNPSATLSLDKEGTVLSTQAMNRDAARLNLDSLKGLTVEEALARLLKEADEAGFLNREREHYMVVSLLQLDPQPDDEALDQLLNRALISLEPYDGEEPLRVQILALKASEGQMVEAESEGIPLNRIVVRDAFQATRGVLGMEAAEVEEDQERLEMSEMAEQVRVMLREKPHPVFTVHPGAIRGEEEKERHFDAHPGSRQPDKDNGQDTQPNDQKSHPVFDSHPGSQREASESDDDQKSHPVFDTHPGNQENKGDGSHPVFEDHPGKNKNGD